MDSQRFTCVDGDNLDTETACRLIVGCVAPRPVAWITSIDEQGRVNAAPFSSYNYVATSPPMVAINIAARATGGATKDTARNIVRSREFLINVASEYNMELMHRSAQEFAPDVSEIEELGIPLLQSRHVKPPRIAISPVQMECRLDQVIVLGRGVNTLYIAEVVAFHLSSEVYDGQRVDTARMRPIARLGGPADTLARGLAHQLQARLQQPVIVDSKAGGAASIGTGFVARAKPDGYTLLMGTSAGHAVTPLMQHIAYDGIADFAFIAVVANQPNVLVVNPDLGVDSLQGLIALAKKQPGKLNYASAGTGGATHLGAEAFLQRAQIRITHVPYGGAAPALKDLLGGQVQVGMLNLGATQAFIEQESSRRWPTVARSARRCCRRLLFNAVTACSSMTSAGMAAVFPAANTSIKTAVLQPATASTPAHCQVDGQINPRTGVDAQKYAINFRLRLPTVWNERFFMLGGGGTDGVLIDPAAMLAQGYATIGTGSGHDNVVDNDLNAGGTASFGVDPQARIDFAYNSYDQVARTGKALLKSYFGKPQNFS